MTWTVVVSTMKHDSTQESVLKELNDKIDVLLEKGWICVADIVYYKNAVSQIMIPVSTWGHDVVRMRPEWDKYWALGSFVPKTLTYEMGGMGHMNVKTKCENAQYYDL
jgi:hypothetical protein